MTAAQIWQIVSIGGGTAVLAMVVAGFLSGTLYTKEGIAERDARIAKLEADNAELRRAQLASLQQSQMVAEAVTAGMQAVQRLTGNQPVP